MARNYPKEFELPTEKDIIRNLYSSRNDKKHCAVGFLCKALTGDAYSNLPRRLKRVINKEILPKINKKFKTNYSSLEGFNDNAKTRKKDIIWAIEETVKALGYEIHG